MIKRKYDAASLPFPPSTTATGNGWWDVQPRSSLLCERTTRATFEPDGLHDADCDGVWLGDGMDDDGFGDGREDGEEEVEEWTDEDDDGAAATDSNSLRLD